MSITVDLEAKILRFYHAEKWRVGTIARELGIHHSTVRRVLNDAGAPARGRLECKSMIDPYRPFIFETLTKYPRLTASRLYGMAKERGYPGGEDHFRSMIARCRPRKLAEAFLRLRTLPGEQGQVDWGHFGHLTIGRAVRPIMAFVMVLSYSRKIFLRFYLNAQMANFLRGHEAAFEAFGGIPRVLLFDNLKSAVLEREGEAIRFNPALLEFAGHYHFEVRPVAVARGNEKGRVERAIRYIRDNFFAAREFKDIDDLNHQADQWCETIAMERRCPEDTRLSIKEAFLAEQASLMKLPEHPYHTDERVEVQIGKTPYARFDLNDYSVPHTEILKTLTVIGKPDKILIIDGTRLLATHVRSYDKAQQIEDPLHIAELVARKREAALHRGQDYLTRSVKNAQALLNAAAEKSYVLRPIIAQLEKLLSMHGPALLTPAIQEALDKGMPHPNTVRLALIRQLKDKHVSRDLHLKDPRVTQVVITPHALSSYGPIQTTTETQK